MSITPVVALTAALCPTITGPTSELLISNGNPSTFGTITQGDVGNLVTQFNRNGVRGDLIGRTGGGCYGIGYGLQLSATGSGLTLNVSLGHAMIDGAVQLAANATLACINGYNWIYLTQGGTLTSTTSATTTPPAPPSAYCCFLGRVHATTGNIDAIDKSGVLTYAGGICYRPTADAGAPTDTPPSTLSFLALTSGGNFMWIGALGAYFNLIDSLKVLTDDTHSTSGSLADLIIGDGTTVTVTPVDTGGGVWKLQLSATTSGGEVVSAYTGDIHPGFLNQKIKTSSDIGFIQTDDTFGTPTSKQLQFWLGAGHVETLNSFTVTIPRGEGRTYYCSFSARGTFSNTNYQVVPTVTVAALTTVIDVYELQGTGVNSSTSGTQIDKTTGRFLIRVENRAMSELGATITTSDTLTIQISLVGPNWTAGGSPGSSVTLNVLDPGGNTSSRPAYDFTRQIYTGIESDVPPGYYQRGYLDLSPAGYFECIEETLIDCQNEGTGLEDVDINILASGAKRPWTSGGPYQTGWLIEVLNPATNVYGYSGHTPILLTVAVSGRRWITSFYSPTSPTFTPIGPPILIDGGGGGGTAWLLGGQSTGANELLGLTDHQAVTVLGGTVTVESDTGSANVEGAVGASLSATTGDATVTAPAGNIKLQGAGAQVFKIDSTGGENWNGNEFNPGPAAPVTATGSLPAIARYQRVSAESGNVTLTIPNASSASGRLLSFMRTDFSPNALEIAAPPNLTYLMQPGAGVQFWSDGTNWQIRGETLSAYVMSQVGTTTLVFGAGVVNGNTITTVCGGVTTVFEFNTGSASPGHVLVTILASPTTAADASFAFYGVIASHYNFTTQQYPDYLHQLLLANDAIALTVTSSISNTAILSIGNGGEDAGDVLKTFAVRRTVNANDVTNGVIPIFIPGIALPTWESVRMYTSGSTTAPITFSGTWAYAAGSYLILTITQGSITNLFAAGNQFRVLVSGY